MFDEIKDDILHILICMFAYKEKVHNISGAASTSLYTAELISLNALAEMIIMRVARLGDKRKDARSIKNLQKRLTTTQILKAQKEIDQFLSDVEPVLKLRHENIAHMKPGTLTKYPINQIPEEVRKALTSLVVMTDKLNSEKVNYTLTFENGSRSVNLRDELFVESSKA